MSLLDDLTSLLQQDERLTANGQLLKNRIIELGLKLDKDLLKLLLSHQRLRAHFFVDVEGVLVFDKEKFIRFVNNKAFLPDSYTAFSNRIGLTVGDRFLSDSRDVVLSWPYKDCVLEGGQTKEDTKRDEVFWNEILAADAIDRLLAPKVLSNFKRYDTMGEHPVAELAEEDNLVIRGNNLLVLNLLSRRFAGQVKLIYIDPPFNTRADGFNYNDSFNHSTWLTFMRNRLSAAKMLLRPGGIILVHCSFHEHAYLKVLMDELLPRYLCTFNIQVRHPDRILTGDKEYNDIIEYILVYSDAAGRLPKREEAKTNNDYVYSIQPGNPSEELQLGKKRVRVFTPSDYTISVTEPSDGNLKRISVRGSIREKNSSGRFFVKHLEGLKDKYPANTLFQVPDMGDDQMGYRYFYLPPEGNVNGGYFQGRPQRSDTTAKPYPNYLSYEKEYNNVASEGGVSFRNGKKPEKLLEFLVGVLTDAKDIVLDYHLGSGTTAAVAHKTGRQYIGIEQMDYGCNDSVQRLNNVINGDQTGISESIGWQGGGSFVYCELMQWNDRHVQRILKATDKATMQAIWQEMRRKAHLSYRLDLGQFDQHAKTFEDLSVEDQRRFLMEALDKNALYVNLSEMDDATYGVSEEDKRLNRQFYGL